MSRVATPWLVAGVGFLFARLCEEQSLPRGGGQRCPPGAREPPVHQLSSGMGGGEWLCHSSGDGLESGVGWSEWGLSL